ncbi:MAG TPA: hypothetical protein VGO93_06925 [Candidatus Xenobia bacterium]|jgi:hypothetical protein
MLQPDTSPVVGTPEQLTAWLGKQPAQKRYRIVEEEPKPEPSKPLPDPKAAASIALLKSWIAQAPTDPEAIREAEEDLLEFQRNMNRWRKEAGAQLLYPDVE